MHPDRRRDRLRRAWHCQALTVGRVDDGDGVATTGGGGLMKLDVVNRLVGGEERR